MGTTCIFSGLVVSITSFIIYKVPTTILSETYYGEVIDSTSETITLEFDKYTRREGPFRRKYQKSEFGPDRNCPLRGDILKVKVKIKNIGRIDYYL